MLTNWCKGLAAIGFFAASPVFIVFALPFGCGLAGDILNAAGNAAALGATTAVCIAALVWVRYRSRPPMVERRTARSLG